MRKSLLSIVLLFASIVNIFAQSSTEQLPIDPEVRIGVLDNGLTYYIRHNAKLKQQASFYIYHDVGAVQEAEHQQGLAHFLEHLAFEDTKHFSGNEISDKLKSIGVAEYSINAFTGHDCTQYYIEDCPVSDENIDLALLILHDWSHYIALRPEGIDAERGVIIEELRTGNNGHQRAQDAMIQNLLKGTIYERRNIIGHMDGLATFDHSALEEFYRTWYRPEYQTIVVVGDINVDQIEAKIKTLMADIPASPSDAPQKEIIKVPTTEEPIISIFTDPELTESVVYMYARRDALPKEQKNTFTSYTNQYIYQCASSMMNYRFEELAQQADAPLLGGGMDDGSVGICPTMEATTFIAVAHEGRVDDAFRTIYTEMERMRRYGFTKSEYERMKKEYYNGAESYYKSRNDIYNDDYAQRYINHFAEGTPIMDAESEWMLDQKLVSSITIDDVNQVYTQELRPNENLVIIVQTPEKEGVKVPTKEDIEAIITEIESSDIEPYIDNSSIEPLIDKKTKLKGSKVKSTTTNESLEYTEWTLKNGIKVVVRPSTFSEDSVNIFANAKGGCSMLSDQEYYQGTLLSEVMSYSGIGKFNSVELTRQLTGKNAWVTIDVGSYSHSIEAGGSPKDIETILQLIYLNFTSPRFDDNDLSRIKNNKIPYYTNLKSNPDYIHSNIFHNTIFNNHTRCQYTSAEHYEVLDIATLQNIHSKLYNDADSFRFVIIGNINTKKLKPLVEKYIGSLPTSIDEQYAVVDDGVRLINGENRIEFRTAMQQPKVSVGLQYSGDMEYNAKNLVIMDLLRRALDARYMISIREEKGGTYSISVDGNIRRYPVEQYYMNISFDTNEELADELIEICDKEIRKIAEEGPLADDIAKSKEYLKKNYHNVIENNNGLSSMIYYWYEFGYNYKEEYLGILESITLEDIQKCAKRMLEDNNRIQVVMRPEVNTK